MKKSDADHDAVSLRRAVMRLRTLLIPAERIAEEMESLGIERLNIQSQAALERAMAELNRWGRSCEEAFSTEMQRRGLFQASSAKPEGKPTLKKSRRRSEA